jgi:hypothetical protein
MRTRKKSKQNQRFRELSNRVNVRQVIGIPNGPALGRKASSTGKTEQRKWDSIEGKFFFLHAP